MNPEETVGNEDAALKNRVGQASCQTNIQHPPTFILVPEGIANFHPQTPGNDRLVGKTVDAAGMSYLIQRFPGMVAADSRFKVDK